MKNLLLTMLIVVLGLPMLAQDIRFPSAIVSAGGSSESSSQVHSRWRLAPVHVITVPQAILSDINHAEKADWGVKLYPNPVEDNLYLDFELPEEREFLLRITDVSGRVMFDQEARTFMDGTSVSLDLSAYQAALYLLQISSPDKNIQKAFRFQKL